MTYLEFLKVVREGKYRELMDALRREFPELVKADCEPEEHEHDSRKE